MEQTLHPDRVLKIASGENVRDLGGYSTRDGATTRWGRFVRSGDMDQLTRVDQQTLIDYGITTVIDLRMNWEVLEKPNVFAGSGEVRFVVHDFWGDRFDDYRSKHKSAPPHRKLADLYCSGLEKSGFVMAEVMTTFADSTDHGFIYHCRSGKDRTGLVTAILLALAGVPEETICADFAFTSVCLKTAAINPIDAGKPGAWQRGCAPETMALTLDFIRKEYSDVRGYLGHIGISENQVRRIRERLLDK